MRTQTLKRKAPGKTDRAVPALGLSLPTRKVEPDARLDGGLAPHPGNGFEPAPIACFSFALTHFGLEDLCGTPSFCELLASSEETRRLAGVIRGAQRRGLGILRHLDPLPENIREPLHEPKVSRHAAIDPQAPRGRNTAYGHVAAHGVQEIARLESDRLEPGCNDIGPGGGAGETEERGLGISIPERGAETLKCGNEIDAGIQVRAFREGLAVSCRCDQAEIISQPLHRGAGHEDRTLEGINALAANLVEDCREHARRRSDLLLSSIGNDETACAIGCLEHAGRETSLTVGGGLLIAGYTPDRDSAAEMLGLRLAKITLAVPYLG